MEFLNFLMNLDITTQKIDFKELTVEFLNTVKNGDYPFMCQSKASFALANIHKYSITDMEDYNIITTFITKVGF